MYIIEMHYKHRAFAQVILEKGDAVKPDLDIRQVLINHGGDVDEKTCRWCKAPKSTIAQRG